MEQRFFEYVRAYRLEEVQEMLKSGAIDPSCQDNHAFILACYYRCTLIVELLLKDHRVDPSASNNYALCLVSKRHSLVTEDLMIIHILLASKKLSNDMFHDIFLNVVRYGTVEVLEMLLRDGRFHNRYTPQKAMNEAKSLKRWGTFGALKTNMDKMF